MTNEQIEEIFTYHAPKEGQPDIYQRIREKVKEAALTINRLCPESREKSIALTHLQSAVMFANASVAISG